MRLVGYALKGGDGPVKEGSVPLGDVTVVFGANDSGKSRLLQAIVRGLLREAETGAVFVELGKDELVDLAGPMQSVLEWGWLPEPELLSPLERWLAQARESKGPEERIWRSYCARDCSPACLRVIQTRGRLAYPRLFQCGRVIDGIREVSP